MNTRFGLLASVICLALGTFIGCQGSSSVGVPAFPSAKPSDKIVFFVFTGSDLRPVSGALVLISTQRGMRKIAESDFDGEVTVSKQFLRDEGVDLISFCFPDDSLSCTSLRFDDPEVYGFDELNVRLSRYTMINRVRLSSP